MAFILYLPGGMAQVLHRFGDLVTLGMEHLEPRPGDAPPRRPGAGSGTEPRPSETAVGDGRRRTPRQDRPVWRSSLVVAFGGCAPSTGSS